MNSKKELFEGIKNLIEEYENGKGNDLNLKQASEYLGYKESTLYVYAHHKKVPCKKYGKNLVFSKKELEEYKKKNTK